MSLKKVVLHPLERLDIVDADALQDLAHAAVFDVAQGLAGSPSAAGLSRPWSSATVNNTTGLIAFSDFSMFLREVDGEGNSVSLPMVYAKFKSSLAGNGTCSFAATKTLVQAYYNTNGALPPVPGDESFDISTHGQYYPYIYARPVVAETDSASRRFWSAADADEITQSVATRTGTTFQFTIVDSSSVPDAPASGYAWTRIGGINQWTVSADVVSLSSSGVTKFYFAESALGVSGAGVVASDFHSGISTGGMLGAVAWIMDHIEAMKTNGTEDSLDRPVLARSDVPRSSMSDLDYRLTEAESDIALLQSTQHLTSSVVCRIQYPGASPYFPTLAFTQGSSNSFDMTPSLNYRPMRQYISGVHGDTVGALTATEWATYISSDILAPQLSATIALAIPEAYRNRRYSVVVEPIYSDIGGALLGSGDGAAADFLKYQSFRRGEQWFAITGSEGAYNQTLSIVNQLRQTQASSTDVSFLGINIGQRGVADWSDIEAYEMRIDIKITVTVHYV